VEIHGQQKPRCFDMEKEGYDGRVKDPTNEDEVATKSKQAFEMAYYRGEQVPLGVLYQIELPTYYDRIAENAPVLNQYTPTSLPTEDEAGRPTTDLSKPLTAVLI